MDDATFLAGKLTALQSKGPQPTKAYMLEIGIDRTGKKVLFGYKQYWVSPTFNQGTAHGEFLAWANGLIAKPIKGERMVVHSKPGQRKQTKMSFRCNELVYLLFKLDDSIDWRFSVDGPAISADGTSGGNAVFFAPKGAGELMDRKRYAYAIADCPKGTSGGSGGDIEAYFNLHVDFLEGGEGDAYIPVVIDPDVRHPGGNGEP